MGDEGYVVVCRWEGRKGKGKGAVSEVVESDKGCWVGVRRRDSVSIICVIRTLFFWGRDRQASGTPVGDGG